MVISENFNIFHEHYYPLDTVVVRQPSILLPAAALYHVIFALICIIFALRVDLLRQCRQLEWSALWLEPPIRASLLLRTGRQPGSNWRSWSGRSWRRRGDQGHSGMQHANRVVVRAVGCARWRPILENRVYGARVWDQFVVVSSGRIPVYMSSRRSSKRRFEISSCLWTSKRARVPRVREKYASAISNVPLRQLDCLYLRRVMIHAFHPNVCIRAVPVSLSLALSLSAILHKCAQDTMAAE